LKRTPFVLLNDANRPVETREQTPFEVPG